MGYESFYGGRQGASFVIVKQFDGIDIPENEKAKVAYYAANSQGIRFYPFIKRNDQNYIDYNWVETTLDGSIVDTINKDTGELEQHELDEEYQEGMVQCFKRGGDSTHIVNYGEYVIIDTISKDNPENGKVFRRGMNFDNNMGGAEYIGQIVGPKGSTADLDMTTYKEVVEQEVYEEGHYSPDEENQGLVPGANDAENEFNDTIDYAWTEIRDDYGNIAYYQVGFKIPYLVQHFIARVRGAYKEDGTPLDDTDELIERIDNKEHNFFSKWKINVPKGIKGESISKITTLPIDIKRQDIKVYDNSSLSGPGISISRISLTSAPAINIQTVAKTIIDGYAEIVDKNGNTYYVKKDDCVNYQFVTKNTKYDNYIDGEDVYAEIGSYRVLKDVSINTETNLEGVFGNQKVHVVYEGANENQNIEEDIGDPLNVIFEAAIVNKADYVGKPEYDDPVDEFGVEWGTFLVYYTDPATRAQYSKTHRHLSTKIKDSEGKPVVLDGWVELGNVLKPGSIQTLCNFDDISELDNNKPPEVIASGDPEHPDDSYRGWVVTVGASGLDKTYYAYDYKISQWYQVGTITADVDPWKIININNTQDLQLRGFEIISTVRKSIY